MAPHFEGYTAAPQHQTLLLLRCVRCYRFTLRYERNVNPDLQYRD
jgi:hypothetical protein